MKFNENDISLIEDYLSGDLTDLARQQVEKRIQRESDFASLVALQKDIAIVLNAQEKSRKQQQWRQLIEGAKYAAPPILKESGSTKYIRRVSRIQRVLRVAAMLLFFLIPVGLYFYFNSVTAHQQLAWAYYEQPQTLAEGVFDITRSADDPANTPFQKGIKTAENLYKAGKLEIAIAVLDTLTTEPNDQTAVQFLKGRCYFMIKQNKKALAAFENVVAQSTVIDDKARWALALTYLQNKDFENCKQTLQTIIEKEEAKSEQAKELLEKLGE